MEIRFKVNYELLHDGCTAEVKLFLPSEKGPFGLHRLLVDEEKRVFDDRLSQWWGDQRGEFRMKYKRVYGKDWDEVEQKVQQLVEETIQVLKEVYKRNKALLERKPESKEIVIHLD